MGGGGGPWLVGVLSKYLLKSEISPSLHVSIRWQQNQTGVTPVVRYNSKLSDTNGDQLKLVVPFRSLLTMEE